MSRRHVETITDLLVVAISPALVIFMVSSLVFFATHCFYDGSFHTRLRIASGLFVIAAVLTSRISIDEGREYATMFAVPLSIVSILSILKYTDAGILVLPLVAFIWWSTDKLTWDCTVIDDKKDASGKGLLQTIGTDGAGDLSDTPLDQEATTDKPMSDSKSIWERWRSHRQRHHTPGVWVVYFGGAAIPLFGLGQMLLPPHSRGAGFLLLCIYVASALALLLTTSFLQMRRYLIQRRLPFTDQMASIWLGTGGTLIVGLMLLCLLLPRPNTGFSLIDSFGKISSHDQDASRVAAGREGVTDDETQGQGESEDEEAESDSEGGTQKSDKAEQGSKSGEKAKTKGGEKSESGESDSSSGENSERGESSGAKQDESEDNGPDETGSHKPQPSDTTGDDADANADNDANDPRQSGSQQMETRTPTLPDLSPNVSLPSIPRLVYFAIIGAVILFVLIRYGREMGAAIQSLLRDLAEMIRRLFGGKPRARNVAESAEVDVALITPPRRFSSFQDPFATGTTDRYTPPQLVNHTFEALQAWANERNCGRSVEQTPLEFAGRISMADQHVGPLARNLAILYNQAAYAPGTLGNESVDHMRILWQALRGQ